MDKEFEKIDKRELMKQVEEEILKGKHVELKILIGEGSLDPVSFFTNTATFKEIGILYACLEETKKLIEKRHPASVLYAKTFLNLEGNTEIDINK